MVEEKARVEAFIHVGIHATAGWEGGRGVELGEVPEGRERQVELIATCKVL